MAQMIIKKPLTLFLSAQKKFTSLQKCILLGLCTLVWGVLLSWWWPALVFLGSLPLSWIVSRQILSGSNIPALPYILKYHKVIIERAQHVLQNFSPSKLGVPEKEPCIKLDNTLPEVEVRETLHLIHRDFVRSWYSYISDEEEFLDEVMQILEELSVSMVDRVKQVDIHKIVPDYVVLVRKHILDYQEAMKHLNTQPNVRRKKDRTKEFKKVDNVVDSFIRLGKCHIAVKNDRELELLYLRVIVESLLKILIPDNLLKCSPGKELILEILSCQVLGNVVEMFCEPEFLHKVMVLLLSNEELDYLEKPNTHIDAVSDSRNSRNSIHALPSDNSLLSEPALTSSALASGSATLDCPANVMPKAAIAETCENPVISISSHHLSDSRPTQEERSHSNNVTDQSQTESSVYSSEETLVKVPLVAEPSQNAAQTMYVSDALAKQFKVSVSNVDKVEVIDALGNHDKSLLTRAVSNDVANKSPSSKLSLDLNGHFTSDDEDTSVDAPEDLAFTPSFFISSDDNISNSSELSGEPNLTPEGSLRSDSGRDSRSLSPAPAKPEINSVHERNTDGNLGNGLKVSDRALRTLDMTDNSLVPNMTRDVTQLIPRYTVDEMVRTSSCSDLLITQRTQPNTQDTHTTGLRKVASFNTLHEKSNGINHPAVSSTVSVSSDTVADLPESSTSHHTTLPTETHSHGSSIPRQMQNSISVVNEVSTDGPVEATSQDMPDDLFMNVQIYATEKIRDPSGSMYTIYLIKYRAWHLEADTWCLRSGHAHRRYREFVTLHDRLEEHPIYKKKIRDVKGPQRWKVLPFGQIEVHGIEARRKFLEGYLQTLITREQVGNSLAIREFLAYEGDARIAFVKKASEVPRIDKMIAKTFSGVMNKLTTRPPPKFSDNSVQRKAKTSRSHGEAGAMKKDTKDGGPADVEDRDALVLDYTYSHSDQDVPVQTMENILSRHVHAMEEPQLPAVQSATDTPADSEGDSDTEGFKDVIEEDEPSVSLDTPVTGTPDYDSNIPLVAQIVDLAVELVKGRNPWVVRNNVITSLKVAAGEELERLLHAEIAELTTEEECARYISLLRELLWPCGELDTELTRPLTDKEKAGARRQARSCLAAFLPGVLPIVVGQEDFDAALDHVMEVIDHPTLNRHLVYSLLDGVLQTVFPQVCMLTLQQQLISRSGR